VAHIFGPREDGVNGGAERYSSGRVAFPLLRFPRNESIGRARVVAVVVRRQPRDAGDHQRRKPENGKTH